MSSAEVYLYGHLLGVFILVGAAGLSTGAGIALPRSAFGITVLTASASKATMVTAISRPTVRPARWPLSTPPESFIRPLWRQARAPVAP